MTDLYVREQKLLNEIQEEKGFSWNKLLKLVELNAICNELN